jgi:hypothetical protein
LTLLPAAPGRLVVKDAARTGAVLVTIADSVRAYLRKKAAAATPEKELITSSIPYFF